MASGVVPAQSPKTNKALLRFFSVDSNINNMSSGGSMEGSEFTNWNCYRCDFFLKIAQLLNGIVCAGLYSEGVKVMTDSLSSLCFPNCVFSSAIIITAVLIMSYMLGKIMPDILTRVFNSICLILYFISATVTIAEWSHKRTAFGPEMDMPIRFLLIQSVLSYVNTVLYGLDMYFSVKHALVLDKLENP